MSVCAIDRDKIVEPYAKEVQAKYSQRFHFKLGKFSNIKHIVENFQYKSFDFIIADLGVSTMQLKSTQRGFSFNNDSSLDMGMGLNSKSAEHVVNNYSEQQIADILYYYGEERLSRQIAAAICKQRLSKPIVSSKQLADIVVGVVARRYKSKSKVHPATKTMQALRIYINDELDELVDMLNQSLSMLNSGGQLVIVSFHSLEDRIVKTFFKEVSQYNSNNHEALRLYKPINHILCSIITKKAILPSSVEVVVNPASSSAKMRILQRI